MYQSVMFINTFFAL